MTTFNDDCASASASTITDLVVASGPAPCCWQDCQRPATDVDSDGDEACALHAAQSERYVDVTDLSGEAWLDEASAERAEALLAEAGWDITIRAPRSHSEIQATYLVTSNGLQYLGHSIPVPEPLRRALREAAERALIESE